jgi:hypothetical protein
MSYLQNSACRISCSSTLATKHWLLCLFMQLTIYRTFTLSNLPFTVTDAFFIIYLLCCFFYNLRCAQTTKRGFDST